MNFFRRNNKMNVNRGIARGWSWGVRDPPFVR